MARYKAAAKLYVGEKLINAGQEFESDLPRGKHWIALDDRGQPVGVEETEDGAKDRAAREAAAKAGHKLATPGLSVTAQQTLGEEPTVGKVHDNEEQKLKIEAAPAAEKPAKRDAPRSAHNKK